jgi:FtsZ-binding cell division protein ZapB
LGVNDLDQTLVDNVANAVGNAILSTHIADYASVHKSVAKIPKVVNEPSSDSENWDWDWTTSADQIIEKLGWRGLAQAVAWYDPDGAEKKDENGYPMSKDCYFLPHHKLINGELTLVWGGVRAAMQRLLQTKARKEEGKIDSKIDFKGAYDHLVSHYKHFGKEPPDFEQSKGSLLEIPSVDTDWQIDPNLNTGDITEIVWQMLERWLDQAEMFINSLLPSPYDGDIDDQTLSRILNGLDIFDALKTKLTQLCTLYSTIKQSQGGFKMEFLDELLKKIEAGELTKEAIKEALGFVEASEIESLQKEIEALKQAKEALEQEYQEFRKAVEAEKEAQRKAELANTRFNELVEAGIEFTAERAEKVKAKLAEMSDEDYADYKAELLEVLASNKKADTQDVVDTKKTAEKDNIFDDEINNEVYNPNLAFQLRQRRAALNIELSPITADNELTEKFQKVFFGEVK